MSKKPSNTSALRASLSQKRAELAAAQTCLDSLQAELAERREQQSPYQQTFNREGPHPNADLVNRATAAGVQVDRLRDEVKDLANELAQIEVRDAAPFELEEAANGLRALSSLRQQTDKALKESEALAAKLDADLAEIEQQMQECTDAAAAAMIESSGAFTMPEELKNLDARLRITKAARQAIGVKNEERQATLNSLPEQIREARREWVTKRERLACFELEKALAPLLPLLAIASIHQRRTGGIHHRIGDYIVRVPSMLMQNTEELLDRELADLTAQEAEGEAA